LNTNEFLSENDWSASSSLKEPVEHLRVHSWVHFKEKIQVECIRLDDFQGLQMEPVVDFIWSDVQGAEDFVIAGATKVLSKTRFFFTEYNNQELYKNQLNLEGILNLLGPHWKIEQLYSDDVLLRNTLL